MRFTLTIELGSDAMQTYPEIIDAIQSSFNSIIAFGEYNDCRVEEDETGTVRDINGNTVGKWEMTQ